jgi:uncharacterized protein YprB with RNaseH-like and TPR domain
MSYESLHRRLEALNRESLGSLPPPAVSKPTMIAPPRAQLVDGSRGEVAFLTRAEEIENSHGRHALIAVKLNELWCEADRLLAGRHQFLCESQAEGRGADVASFLAAFPQGFVGIDLETCGLGGSALFLVGLVRHVGGELVIELLLARNYAEEAAVLVSLGERIRESTSLLTFNGKSFDWPTVGDRWRRYLLDRVAPLPELPHFDVLHHARRKWRRQLPNCRLQTLERMICRRTRTGDIPGHLIPAAYDRYVRTGDGGEIEGVLYHNALDLVTLVDVAMRVAV